MGEVNGRDAEGATIADVVTGNTVIAFDTDELATVHVATVEEKVFVGWRRFIDGDQEVG